MRSHHPFVSCALRFSVISPCTSPLYFWFYRSEGPRATGSLYIGRRGFVCLFRSPHLTPPPLLSFLRYPCVHFSILQSSHFLFVYPLCVLGLLERGRIFLACFFLIVSEAGLSPFGMEKYMRIVTRSAHGGSNAYLTTTFDWPCKTGWMLAIGLRNTTGNNKPINAEQATWRSGSKQ